MSAPERCIGSDMDCIAFSDDFDPHVMQADSFLDNQAMSFPTQEDVAMKDLAPFQLNAVSFTGKSQMAFLYPAVFCVEIIAFQSLDVREDDN